MQLKWLPLIYLATFAVHSTAGKVTRDVYFLLDASASIGNKAWDEKVIPFVKKMRKLSKREQQCYRKEVRQDTYIEFSSEAEEKPLDNLKYIGELTNPGAAMKLAASKMNKKNENVCVIITDGTFSPKAAYIRSLEDGIKIFLKDCKCVIGISPGSLEHLEDFSRKYELYDVLVSLDVDCFDCVIKYINELICDCGKSCEDVEDIAGTTVDIEESKRKKRVIDDGKQGLKAKENQFPYMVGLGKNNKVDCGAAIISCKHMLTSASCAKHGDKQGNVQVYIGSFKYASGIIRTAKLTPHAGYDSTDLGAGNDIALLTLQNPIKVWSKGIRPIRLPTDRKTRVELKTMGWGLIGPGMTNIPKELRYTDKLVGTSSRRCRVKIFTVVGEATVGSDITCAEGTTKQYSGMALFDQGGPTVVEKDGVSYLIGLNTHTLYNILATDFYVMTRVFPHINWPPLKQAIEDNIKKP